MPSITKYHQISEVAGTASDPKPIALRALRALLRVQRGPRITKENLPQRQLLGILLGWGITHENIWNIL